MAEGAGPVAPAAAPQRAPTLVRITIASATTCVDLSVPGAVPVADLLPELARHLGVLDSTTASGGYHLVGLDGRVLTADSSLLAQGVEDGALLTVVADAEIAPPRRYDDLAEAVADAVEGHGDLPPPGAGRRAALVGAGVQLTTGAVVLAGADRDGMPWLPTALVVVAAALVIVAMFRSWRDDATTAIVLTASAAGQAAAAGALLAGLGATGSEGIGAGLAGSGGAMLVVGLIAAVGLQAGRAVAVPVLALAVVGILAGLTVTVTGSGAGPVLTVVLVVAVLGGESLPSVAWAVTGSGSGSASALEADHPAEIEIGRVRGDVRLAQQVMLAGEVAVAVLVVALAPAAVAEGVVGTTLAVACCVVVMLRCRGRRSGGLLGAPAEVRLAMGTGLLGLVATLVSWLCLHPQWHRPTGLALVLAGLLLVALVLAPGHGSPCRGWWAEVAHRTILVCLLPLLVVAVGGLDLVRG